jgi:hypothetical protein
VAQFYLLYVWLAACPPRVKLLTCYTPCHPAPMLGTCNLRQQQKSYSSADAAVLYCPETLNPPIRAQQLDNRAKLQPSWSCGCLLSLLALCTGAMHVSHQGCLMCIVAVLGSAGVVLRGLTDTHVSLPAFGSSLYF